MCSERKIILQKGSYALIECSHEYIVVCGFDGKQWSHGYYFSHWNESDTKKAISLSNAVDFYRCKTEENYISRLRLEELATKFKDGMFEADSCYAHEYIVEEMDLEEHELDWLSLYL